MNIFTLAVLIGVLIIGLGALFMWMIVSLDGAVAANEATIAEQKKVRSSVNPKNTGGFAIATEFSLADQLTEARKLAARRAARQKRGENMGIGRSGTVNAREEKKHVTAKIAADPMNAVKIAKYHTWNGLQYVKGADTSAAPAAEKKVVMRKITPGRDYPFTVLTGLSGAERRAAAVANAKAKAAAYAKLKAAGKLIISESESAPAPAAAPAAAAPAAPAAPSVDLPPSPVLTVITDDMDRAAKKAAKLSNTKAKSAYKKQLKAMGIDPKSVEWTETGAVLKAAAAPATPAPAATPAASAAPAPAAEAAPAANVPPPPELIAITADMDSAEKKAAKLSNIKAKSAYKKQLKAMGIDPKTVKF